MGDAVQQDLFKRGWKLNMLNQLQLPQRVELGGSGSVSAAAMRGVLRAIDDSARDDAQAVLKIETIANKTGLSIRSVQRALRALQELDLLIVQKRVRSGGKAPSAYQICWSNLIEFEEPNQPEDPPDQCATMRHGGASMRHGGASMRHGGASMRHGGASITKRPLKRLSETPPPPAPSSLGSTDEWREVEEVLRSVGVRYPNNALNPARSRNVSPAEVLAIVDVYRQHSGAWQAGALYERIRGAHPGEPADDLKLWPEQCAKYKARQRGKRQAEETRRLTRGKSAKTKPPASPPPVAQQLAAKLNTPPKSHAAQAEFDELTQAERDALARELLSDFGWQLYQRCRDGPAATQVLLNAMAARDAAAESQLTDETTPSPEIV